MESKKARRPRGQRTEKKWELEDRWSQIRQLFIGLDFPATLIEVFKIHKQTIL